MVAILFPACNSSESAAAEPTTDAVSEQENLRIVSLNGALTELLYQLGFGEQLVGVDVTSTYPAAVHQLPKLGHVSQLNVEGLLELKPDLILVSKDDMDKPGLVQLQSAGVQIEAIAQESRLDNALVAAKAMDAFLPIGSEKLGQLEKEIQAELATLDKTLEAAKDQEKPSVLFIYARGAGRLLVAGTETSAAQMIELTGGRNAITTFSDFEALTPEALLVAKPDVILMFESGLASLDGLKGLAQIPGISQTPAFQNERVIAMDGHYLLGFGPRAGKAANELASQLTQTEAR